MSELEDLQKRKEELLKQMKIIKQKEEIKALEQQVKAKKPIGRLINKLKSMY
jgi:hypothetical protein